MLRAVSRDVDVEAHLSGCVRSLDMDEVVGTGANSRRLAILGVEDMVPHYTVKSGQRTLLLLARTNS